MLKLWRFIVDVLLNRKIVPTPSDFLTRLIAAACTWGVVRNHIGYIVTDKQIELSNFSIEDLNTY